MSNINYYMISIFILKLILISIIISQTKYITSDMKFNNLSASLKASSILLLILTLPAFYIMWINRFYFSIEQRLIRYTGLIVDFIFSISIVASLFNISNTTVNTLNGLTSVGIITCIFNTSYNMYDLYYKMKLDKDKDDIYEFRQFLNGPHRNFIEIDDIQKYIPSDTDSEGESDNDNIYKKMQYSSDDELP